MKAEVVPAEVFQAENLRKLAWDLAEWSSDPPLMLSADDQLRIATILNNAANTIDRLKEQK